MLSFNIFSELNTLKIIVQPAAYYLNDSQSYIKGNTAVNLRTERATTKAMVT